ncbi:uncharacterized protein LOC118407124 [Branchiostoma floridae]|uniref:Uncharacterized protein LOC118407124 n=1 Tax=Branchiostoma floridae TaxID=7739 RepID=A0A9J7HU33_BRAFL|nr:uncharacterized protein LOC118407124 [Branchiostoma floridae]
MPGRDNRKQRQLVSRNWRPWLAFEHPEKTMDQYLSRDGRSMQNRHPADLEAWATQVEINAMSSLLGRRIFVYGKHGFNIKWEWMKYPWCESNTSMLDGRNAIYMQHTNGNHFDVVTATVFNKRQTRSMSRRHREETTEASQVACIKRKTVLNANNDDDDRKRVRRDRERKRYQEDPEYAKAQRDGKKTRYRYHTDDDYSNKMKVPEIPPELKSLNTLESQLIAKRIPFMKVAALPKGAVRQSMQTGLLLGMKKEALLNHLMLNKEGMAP